MEKSRGPQRLPIHDDEIVIEDVELHRCQKCGMEILDPAIDDAVELRALEVYRKRNGLLGAEEISALRGRLGLQRRELARLLRVETEMVRLWEEGDWVPTPTH